MIYNFIWGGKKDRIKRTELSNQIEDEKHVILHCKKFNTYLMKKYQIYLKMQVIKMLTTK